jgi:hypothetical protein
MKDKRAIIPQMRNKVPFINGSNPRGVRNKIKSDGTQYGPQRAALSSWLGTDMRYTKAARSKG